MNRKLWAILIAASFLAGSVQADDADESPADMHQRRRNPQNVMGIVRGDCKKCHPSEVAAWTKTVHFQSAKLRLYNFTGNTKKYAEALSINRNDLLTTSMCADCHGTKMSIAESVEVASGVSCESCHGAAGGLDGWLNRHQSYHASTRVTRKQETAEHRQQRIADCENAGMLRSDNIYGLVRNCFQCHMVTDEKLIAAGHKTSSASFEFVSWSEGEIKHNFLLNRDRNEDAPSLWLETHGKKPELRRRVKFVVGALTQLEMLLRSRASMKSPAIIPQVGGSIAAINGKLSQINGMAPSDELRVVVGEPAKGNLGLITPLLGTLFVAQETDSKTYAEAADKVADAARNFATNHDGSKLPTIDALIQLQPPHFSQQFRQKYLKE